MAIDERYFIDQLERLNVLPFAPEPHLLREYWKRLQTWPQHQLAPVIDALLDKCDRFPTVKQFHEEFGNALEREHDNEQKRTLTPEAAYAEAKRNVRRIMEDGMVSDLYLGKHGSRVIQPGTQQHTAVLRMYDRLVSALERRLSEPNSQHASDLLGSTLSRLYERRDTFENTGVTIAQIPVSELQYISQNDVPGALYHCLSCRDTRFVKAEAPVGTTHFGAAIPCPQCQPVPYMDYVQTYGVPNGFPKEASNAVTYGI